MIKIYLHFKILKLVHICVHRVAFHNAEICANTKLAQRGTVLPKGNCLLLNLSSLFCSFCQFIIKYQVKRQKAKLSIFLCLPFSSQSPHLVYFQNYIQKVLGFVLSSLYGMLDSTSISFPTLITL